MYLQLQLHLKCRKCCRFIFLFYFWECVMFFFLLLLQLNDVVATRCCSLLQLWSGREERRSGGGTTPSPAVPRCVLPAWLPGWLPDKRVSWPCFVHWSNYYLLLLPPRRAGVNCAGNLGQGLCLISGLQCWL